jgi:hypothetical protein
MFVKHYKLGLQAVTRSACCAPAVIGFVSLFGQVQIRQHVIATYRLEGWVT